jgi:TonB family protein
MNWINYLLQVNFYLLITFGFYWLVLRNETFYNANRFYLMAASLLSFGIPFWQSGIIQSWAVTEQVSAAVSVIPLQEFTINNLKETPTWDWNLLLVSIYFFGFGFGLLRFSIGLFKLQQLFNLKNMDGQAFSVFGGVFIDKNLKDYQTIKNHEEVHSQHFHSLDVFWFELLGVICWFNPIAHFLQKEIKLVHEYIADEYAATQLGSKKAYAQVLVSTHFKANNNVLVNNFYNKSILKTRIMMLSKEKSKKSASLKYGLIVPVFAGLLIFSASCDTKENEINASELAENEFTTLNDMVVTGYKSVEKKKKKVPLKPDIPAEFPGGNSAMYKFLASEIRYPPEAQRTNTVGKVMVKFAIHGDGEIGSIEILEGIGQGCEEEAIRVISKMPKWTPAMKDNEPILSYYTFPVVFQLEEGSVVN